MKTSGILIAVVSALGLVQPAHAGMQAVSPFNPPVTSNGFPRWYTDTTGTTVELPIPPIGNVVTAPTMIYAPLTAQSNVVAQRAGFDAEAFYFNARPDPKNFKNTYGPIAITFGLEASYANLVPTDGQQVVFSRIRVKAPVKVAGTYTFFHPWGTESINVTTTDIQKNKGIIFTKDFGLSLGWLANADGTFSPAASPSGFFTVLQPGNTMSTFLRQVSPAPPPGWIGDGVTPAMVTGSPINFNKVRLEGPDPNFDGKGHNFVETNLFVVAGHIPTNTAVPLPMNVDRVTCSNINGLEAIDLFITSDRGAAVTVKDANPPNNILFNGIVASASGKYYQSFPGSSKQITITVSASNFLDTAKTVPVVDYINIISAQYSLNTQALTVTATSSDFSTARGSTPTLTVTGFGQMGVDTFGKYTLGPVTLTAPLPPTITVTSSVGGSDSTPVAIVP